MFTQLLNEVKAKWYDIGIQLDISPGTLDAIKSECHGELGACLREMGKHWINTDENATYDALEEALSSGPVGENVLADKIAQHSLSEDGITIMMMCGL